MILVLPDVESVAIALGYVLRPRFLKEMGGNPTEVAAVLRKMISTYGMKEVKGQWWN